MGTPKSHLQLSPRQFGMDAIVKAGNDPFPEQWLNGRKMILKKIPIDSVDLGHSPEQRGTNYPDTWTGHDVAYMHKMAQQPNKTPPIIVAEKNDEGKHPLWDGAHRTFAHAKAGRKRIKAFVPVDD